MYKPDASKQFGAAIKRLLDEKGLSQRQFAAKTGLDTGYLSKLVNGKIEEPRREIQEKLARGFGLSIEQLFTEIQRLNSTTDPDFLEPVKPESVDRISQRIQEIRSRQCPKLINLHGRIRLPLTRQQVDVQDLYVDVYVLTRLSADYRASLMDLWRTYDRENDRVAMGQRESDRRDGEETVKQDRYRRSVIVGKPGSGKSTFMQRLVVGCCLGEIFADRIPSLILLRDIQSADFNLKQHLQQEWQVDQEILQEILESGQVLLLLDGLDEVPEQFQKSVKQAIEQFARDYYQVGMIVTCRTQTVEYNLGNFAFLEVADFNPEQVETFARKWFTANDPASAEHQTENFLAKLEHHPSIRELAITPILLGLTCLVFRDSEDLPAQRGELYEQGIELLLEKWDQQRDLLPRTWGSNYYHNLTLEQKQDLLGALALYKFQQKGNFVLFKQSELHALISSHCHVSQSDSSSILKTIEECNGLLIRRANTVYSFSHLTFQEYFVARELTKLDNQKLLGSITDQHWREVFNLAINHMKEPDDLLLRIKRQSDELLAKDPKLQEFLQWVDGKARSVNTSYKASAVRVFYFAHALDLNLALALNCDHALDLALDLNLALALNHALDRAYNHALDRAYNLARDRAYNLTYNRAYNLDRSHNLYIQLKILRKSFPNHREESLKNWWKSYDNNWIFKYKKVIREYRNICHDWNFTTSQKDKLKQYYNANNFLVDCLKGECSVSPQVRQEIEETLLLPLSQLGYESYGLN